VTPCSGRLRGSVMVLFALMIPGIVALMGLVVDMGRLLAERRQLQAAADASAWAAATEFLWGSPGNAGAVTQWYAEQNGYGPTSDATVTVSQPPTSGAYVGQGEYIQVTVRRPLTLTLAQIVHPDPITIVVTATAGPSLGPAPYGLLALNSTSGGIVLNGSVLVRNSSAASNHQISSTARAP
jgi:Flp pilus assembly protein TadG